MTSARRPAQARRIARRSPIRLLPLAAAAFALLAAFAPAQDAASAPAAQEPDASPQLFFAPQRRALVVGAGAYEHLGRLRYANSDARAISRALVEQLGFEEKHVRLLTDDGDDPELTPTAGHLIGELEHLLADPRRNASDLFVFYFSGHGIGLPEGDFLMPTDARQESAARVGLPVKEIVDRLASANMHNVLVVIDACRSGEANSFGRELWQLADAARISVVLSCEPGTRSYEDATRGHGVFTSELLRALGDPSLRDARSGARWASRVMASASAGVSAWSAKREPRQNPAVWTDPTRDVLLDAALPEGGPEFLLADAERLDPQAYLAAVADVASQYFVTNRMPECIEVLKAAEQVAPLPPELSQLLSASLIVLGRSVEAARVLQELRVSAPDSIYALASYVADVTGATPPAERAAASRALWDSGAELPVDLIVLMVQAHLQGGSGAEALALAESVLGQMSEGTRDQAYLSAVVSILRRSGPDPDMEMARAEALPGRIPATEFIRMDRVFYAVGTAGIPAGLVLLDDAISKWPEQGMWYAQRAWYRRMMAPRVADLSAAVDDARAALERPLDPVHIWLAVRAAGVAAPSMHALIKVRAAEHPLSWMAQISEVFARQPENLREEVEAVSRLSPRPALVYTAFTRLTLDAIIEQQDAAMQRVAPNSPEAANISGQTIEALQSLFHRILPMAADFGGDPDAWQLLFELSQRMLQYEAFVRLFERQFAADIDAGRLAESLVPLYARACLNTGRLERFRQVTRSLLRDSTDADILIWQEALFLACAGRNEEARVVLGDRREPRSSAWTATAAELRGLLAIRSGAAADPRAELPAGTPERLLPMAVRALSLRALGDHAQAEILTLKVEELNSAEAFFVVIACLAARPQADPREEALRAAMFQPGNPIVASISYLGKPDLTAFVDTYEFEVDFEVGGSEAVGSTVTLTILPDGRVLGALINAQGGAAVVQGKLDAYGNLEAQAKVSAGALTILAKLAPRVFYRDYSLLAEQGQALHVIAADGIPHVWRGRLRP
jgi:tetratricopeptide (TPR) repeat protein